jgi:hypothetical protein
MTHYSDDELALYFYGEASRPEKIRDHLDRCEGCAAHYAELAAILKLVTAPPIPERDERYGLEVWQRIRPQLPVAPPAVLPLWRRRVFPIAALATAAVIVFALVDGGGWPGWPGQQRPATVIAHAPSAVGPTAPASNADAADRVRRAAIGDHLEQSERLLLDFANADGRQIDVTSQRAWADELLQSNRLYRDAASLAGDAGVADVLDDLERSLLDIANGPSTLTEADHQRVQRRVDTSTLLFKLRVLSDALHEDDTHANAPTRKLI